MPLPGQLTAFFDDPEPEPARLGEAPLRPAVSGRAGTPIRHEFASDVVSQARRGRKLHGLYDESQRLYQTGGELSSFVFWKKNLVSISMEAWRLVFDKIDWIEIIDHERNECWRIQARKAAKFGVSYEAGIGERFGVPMDLWDVITADGKYRKRGKAG